MEPWLDDARSLWSQISVDWETIAWMTGRRRSARFWKNSLGGCSLQVIGQENRGVSAARK
jgi:hypothetical protein